MKRKLRLDTSEKNISSIINGRLSLQSTRQALDSYHIPVKQYSFNYFKSAEFAEIYSKWDEKKRQDFLILLGGTYNKVLAEKYIKIN